jgi:hypothetical protein
MRTYRTEGRIDAPASRRALYGGLIGLGMAMIPVLFGLVFGALASGGEWMQRVFVPDSKLLVAFLGFSLSGVLGGLIYPLGTTRIGAAVGGILQSIPAVVSIAVIERGSWLLTADSLVAGAMVVLTLGTYSGFLFLRWLF